MQGHKEPWRGVDMSATLIVVIVSWLSASVEVCHVVHSQYTQSIVCPLHSHNAGGKERTRQKN